MEVVGVLRECGCAEDFRGEGLRVGGEVFEEALKGGGVGAGNEDGAAPVMQKGSGEGGIGRQVDPLDERVSAEEAWLGGWRELRDEAGGAPVLGVQACFDDADVASEEGEGCGGGLRGEGCDVKQG